MSRRIPQPSAAATLTLILISAFSVTPGRAQDTTTLPSGQVGEPYSISIGVDTENGKGPFAFKLVQGELPPGLQLTAAGSLTGTPTGTRADAYLFELSVSDSSQPPQSATLRFSIAIASARLRVKAVTGAAAQFDVTGVNVVDATASSSPSIGTKAATPSVATVAETQPASASATSTQAPDPPTTMTESLVSNPSDAHGSVSGKATGNTVLAEASKEAEKGKPPDQKACWKTNEVGYCGGPLLRTIVGFEQAGVSAAQSKQDFFFDLLYDRPLGPRVDPDLGAALRGWGNLRISSVPQQINTSVAQFAADFAQQVGNLKVNQVAQSFEFLGGIEYRLLPKPPKDREKPRLSDIGYATPPPSSADIREVVSLNLILGGGVITPLTPQDSVQIFEVPTNQPSFLTLYPQAMGKQFVAFTLPDRNRFFRQAYGGLRLKSHVLGDTARVRFPETFDVTYGFNESITGGLIRGGVLRLEGFVPIPYPPASSIYFFGTGVFKPGGHPLISSPFLLRAAPAGTLPTDPNAVVITTPQANRDYYRIGMGVDFINLVKNWGKKNPAPDAAGGCNQ